jgi:hypothetical protein
MRLLEIEARHWRGLSQSLGPLSPRLNLVLGPNEAGKSRLFEAIHFALFESYKGAAQHKQRLQSWTSTESPLVRLVIELDGRRYELQKQFLKGAMAQLSGGGATLRDEDAEAQLRTMLGTRPGGPRGSSVQDLGIWPLLMVAQGDSRRGTGEDLNDDGRARLHQRLSQEIGVAAISEHGQRLMERVEEERSRYYTPTSQETTLLRNARRVVEEADHKYQQALAGHQSREHTAAELQRARTELIDLNERFETANRESEEAEQRAAAAQKAAERLAAAQGALNTAIASTSSAERDLKTRQEADEAIQRLDDETAGLQSQIDALSPRQSELEARVHEALQRISSAELAHRQAGAALENARRERRRQELTDQHDELRAKVAELKHIELDIQAAQDQRARELPIGSEAVGRLQNLEEVVRVAEARLHGAAVGVVVTLRQAMTVDGVPQPAGASVAFDVVTNRTLTLGEVADIQIQPGRGTLDKLRDAKTEADAALAMELQACGVPTVQEARAAHERLAALNRQIEQLTVQARATWSKSRDQLREDLLRIEAELGRLGPVAVADGVEETLQAAVVAAEADLSSARAARDAANDALAKVQSDAAALRAARQGKLEEHERLSRQYAGRPIATLLAERQQEALRARARAQQELEKCQREYEDFGGEEAQRDATRLSRATQALSTRLQDARGLVDRLTGTLNAALGAGSYESVQEAASELEHARAQLRRLERQAAAAQRLREVLSEERRRVVERLTAPVIQRVKPYLVSIFPGCQLDMGEDLGMVGLRSDTLREPFNELSSGAQEQLALLTRLGIAEVLAGEGTLPIVLDDSLVNTDPDRIRRIHRVLFRAAEKLQVLLLSCHDVLFDGLGAEQVFNLSSTRR